MIDAASEAEKQKVEKAKLIKQFEQDKNDSENKIDTLDELVKHLTEEKLDLVSKVNIMNGKNNCLILIFALFIK